MTPDVIAQIALQLCDLLQLQLDSIIGHKNDHKLDDLTPNELENYQRRKARIAELRAELHRLTK
jgi:hypothetical protein